jgi:hypothetical protein
MVYIALIMTTQANKCVGWPPLIPLNYERQRSRLVVNIGAWGLVARPYQLVLKYSSYKKYTYLDSHVRVFHASSCSNEWQNLGVHH